MKDLLLSLDMHPGALLGALGVLAFFIIRTMEWFMSGNPIRALEALQNEN